MFSDNGVIDLIFRHQSCDLHVFTKYETQYNTIQYNNGIIFGTTYFGLNNVYRQKLFKRKN